MPRLRVILLCAFGAVVAALPLAPRPAAARVIPGDAFLCAEARSARAPRGGVPLPTFHARVGVSVVDRFTRPLPSERYTLDLKKPEAFCPPVRLDREDVTDPLHGFEIYEARRTRRKPAPPPLPPVIATIESAFGVVQLRIAGVDALQVPTLATGSVGGSGPERDHFACYQVKEERTVGARRGVLRVDVQTSEARRTVEVRKPVRLCVPASVRGDDPGAPKHTVDLLCFDARVARSTDEPRAPAGSLLSTRNPFGNEVLKIGDSRLLCVPAARTDVAVPTPTPFATITPPPTPSPTGTAVRTPHAPRVRIEGGGPRPLVRDRVCFAAYLELDGGIDVDVSATALWRVVDGTVAVPAGFLDGKKCFAGVGIGTTALTARDGGTGAVSPSIALGFEWPIFQLTVSPKQVGLRPGESETLTVTATFTGNRTRNVTQYVRYDSMDQEIARLGGASGNRSRIEAAGEGTTRVVISDTLSSLSDSTAVSVGGLRSITVEQPALLFPGERASLQATGVFGAGFTGNLTQIVSYESSDPAIVVALNAPGDRSRVEGVSPGAVVITAVDPATGIWSTCCGTISVLGDVLDLSVTPFALAYRLGVGGDPLAIRAFGTFAIPPAQQASRVVTDRLTWSAVPPGIVRIDGIGLDQRQRLVPLAGGETQVVATDPASGVATAATVTVYDHLDRIDVGDAHDAPTALAERAIAVGATTRYFAHGYFDGGRHAVLPAARFVASDPTVVEFDGGYALGIRPGTVVVSAIDDPSGRTSDEAGGRSAVLEVFGDIERLVLAPPTVTLDVGQTRALTVIGHHTGGATEPFTQRVDYSSSDPSVVVASNVLGNRSRIVAVGAGTATISAHDPITGVTTSASGDDTVVTVRSTEIVRIAVSPPTRRVPATSTPRFTAIAYFADGNVLNVTQRVVWTSSPPEVAIARNPDGDRSRIDVRAPGTAAVTAFDPLSGISATDSEENATLTVEALAALTLAPATLELAVGQAAALTTVGLVDGGDPINVTQEAVYTSSDPTVVRATNQAGNKSRIEAIAPGVATITAFRTSNYPQATDSNAITVTVLP